MSDQIIDSGHNTSYITSLLVALFYKSSNLINILNKDPLDKKFIYVQELIREQFTDPLQRGFSIDKNIINEFRNYIFSCGWKNTIDEILEEQDVGEFFQYMIDKIYGDNIMSFSVRENLYKKDIRVAEIKTNIVRLTIPDGADRANLTELFKMWIKRNITMQKYKYKMNKYFMLLPMYIDRPQDRKVNVDIMYKIKYFQVSDNEQDKLTWYIHSIICKSASGYYTIVRCGKEWIKITDKSIPSFIKIDMNDEESCKNISQDSCIVFYRCYNNIL
jgi:hypothetical protein